MFHCRRRIAVAGALAGVSLSSLVLSPAVSPALAQQIPGLLPEVVVTANRNPQPAWQVGSAISVITRDEIEKASAQHVGDLLRRVPGVSSTQNGGTGAVQYVRLRGMDSRHTLVLVDGVRVSDPSSTGGEFDFANLILSDVERIEVLRGPQSALYGSDAMGGVINIITRRGEGPPKMTLRAEAGSYGTKELRAGISGGTDALSYSLGASAFQTAGFSRFGYRIGRIDSRFPWGLEADGASRYGVTGRIVARPSENVELEAGGTLNLNRYDFDGGFGSFPDTPARGDGLLGSAYTKARIATFGGMLTHSFTLFGARQERSSRSPSYFGTPASVSRTDYFYNGARAGAEYQGDLKLGSFSLLTFGGKFEHETFDAKSQAAIPALGPRRLADSAQMDTRSAFLLYQLPLFERLNISLGGRIDDVKDVDTFKTWRATAAYSIPETGTKLRASAGTSGKAPSLYQRFSRDYGNPNLESEHSVGIDAGIDQSFWNGRASLSATVFLNRYRNFIDFTGAGPSCRSFQAFGCYVNVARAETKGVELEGRLTLIDQYLTMKLAYTNLRAQDRDTGKDLPRRPAQEGRLSFEITPLPGLTIEPAVIFVGRRFDAAGERNRLAPYARFDVYADYKLNDNFSLFARAENLTDARYQEVRDYGTAGRSIYGGVKASW